MIEINTLYKLIILDMLDQADFPLTNMAITSFFLNRSYTTDYLNVQYILSELAEESLIESQTRRGVSYYTITPDGCETLGLLSGEMAPSVHTDIRDYLKENKVELREQSSVIADYRRNSSGEFNVRCRVIEKEADLIDLMITVPDEAQAKAICSRWRENSSAVYAMIMRELMQEGPADAED